MVEAVGVEVVEGVVVVEVGLLDGAGVLVVELELLGAGEDVVDFAVVFGFEVDVLVLGFDAVLLLERLISL